MGVIIFVTSCILFKISFSYLYFSKYGPGAGLFPRWISGALILVSSIYIWETLKNGSGISGDFFPKGRQLQYILRIVMSFALLIILAPLTGYTIASIVMLFILFSHDYGWIKSLGYSVVTSVILVALFYRVLDVPLPLNSFGW